jgi:hypothetical protein
MGEAAHAALEWRLRAGSGGIGQPGEELGAAVEVFAHIVIVDRLLEQTALGDQRVYRRGCCVGLAQQFGCDELAYDPSVGLDPRLGADHLQVKDDPAGFDRLDHLAQDVHDVLRLYSSE